MKKIGKSFHRGQIKKQPETFKKISEGRYDIEGIIRI